MNKNTRRKTLLQMEVGLGKKIVLSALIMFFLIFFVYFFRIPNPNMIMLTGLVLCCAMFGYRGGITAAVIMLFYTLFFFSEDHSFIRFTNVNLQKVMVSLMGITMDVILVCSLKRAELKAFEEIDILTEELKKENELLSRASTTDPLTGIRNRLALSQDIERYLHHEVIVMMLDIDKFKTINDTCGHEEGDRVLKETGELITSVFGKEYCYRFGGDEFLVVGPEDTEAAFREKITALMEAAPVVILQGQKVKVGYSTGYVKDRLEDPHGLDELLSRADQKMYDVKKGRRGG